jgi:hypothetical protein
MLPIVSTLLGNGLSLLANAAVVNGKDYVKDRTGVDLDKPILSQQDLVALKRYEAEHEEELLKLKLEDNQLGIDELKAYVGEKSDARKREVDIASAEKAPLLNKIAAPTIAFGTILLTFSIFYFVMVKGLPAGDGHKDVAVYILGVLSAISSQIFSYYFGSSLGSADKSRAINNALEARR